jgi:hypothetical protein
MLSQATIRRDRPEWVRETDHPADAWMVLGTDYACPMRWTPGGELEAVTVLSRGSMDPRKRAHVNEVNARRRRRRSTRWRKRAMNLLSGQFTSIKRRGPARA